MVPFKTDNFSPFFFPIYFLPITYHLKDFVYQRHPLKSQIQMHFNRVLCSFLSSSPYSFPDSVFRTGFFSFVQTAALTIDMNSVCTFLNILSVPSCSAVCPPFAITGFNISDLYLSEKVNFSLSYCTSHLKNQ